MKRNLLLRALRRRGRDLMRRWQRLCDHFGDGVPEVAERIYPRLISYRRRAMRIARRLHKLTHPSLNSPVKVLRS